VQTTSSRSGPLSEQLASAGRVSGSLRVFPPGVLFEAATRLPVCVRLVMRQPTSGGLFVAVFRGGQPAMVFSPADGRSLADLLAAAGAVDRDTLDRLAQARSEIAGPLHRLVIANTRLEVDTVQRFLDFQARQRLLDALVWTDGYFELEEYRAAAETEFTLALPSIAALQARAEARRDRLPGLLARLPAAPRNTLVHRRRGGAGAASVLEDRVLQGLRHPRLLDGLVARTLVDDDLLVEAVLALADRDAVRLEPRARLVETPAPESGDDLRADGLVRDILASLRGGVRDGAPATLWLVVCGATFATARALVGRLGDPERPGPEGERNGITSVTLHPTPGSGVCLHAVEPAALTRGVLDGVMGRCEGVLLVRDCDDPDATARLQRACEELLAVRREDGWRPAVLGVERGVGLRTWPGPAPDAVLTLPDPGSMGRWAILGAVLEGVLAAVHGRESVLG